MDYPDRKRAVELENGLITRFIGGDEAAFTGLVELYKDRIHQFSSRYISRSALSVARRRSARGRIP
jgi:hypothetical protein